MVAAPEALAHRAAGVVAAVGAVMAIIITTVGDLVAAAPEGEDLEAPAAVAAVAAVMPPPRLILMPDILPVTTVTVI